MENFDNTPQKVTSVKFRNTKLEVAVDMFKLKFPVENP